MNSHRKSVISSTYDHDENCDHHLQISSPIRRSTISSFTSSVVHNITKQPCWLCRWYSTFLVKYSWCFLSLGFIICISLGTYAVLFRDLPDFNDPTKGFVPRGKHTLTSRLFVLSEVKNEIEQQLIAAKVIGNKNSVLSSSSTFSPQSLNYVDPMYEDDDGRDDDDDDSLDAKTLLDDFNVNSNECAFPSKTSNQCLTNQRVYQLIQNQSDFIKISKPIEEKLRKPNEHMCTSIDLNRHYEVYFESTDSTSTNLLTFEHLRSLCKKQSELVELFQLHSTCHFTLPQLVAFFAEKSDCEQITPEDIPNFIERIQRCHSLYDAGVIRLVGLHRYQKNPLELFQYDTCFRYNFTFLALEYLLDKSFLETNQTKYTGMWFLKPTSSITNTNQSSTHTADTAYDLFIEHFYENPKFDDGITRISALNFLDIRISTAMKQIRVDMFFVILAITLIIAVTVIYLRSITVALMTNICVVLAFACAYFAYKVILGIDLFPYINLMSTFILIGISCDNVFVIFDAWYAEKLDIYNDARLHNRPVEFYAKKLTAEQERHYNEDRNKTALSLRQHLNAKQNQDNDNEQQQGDEKHFNGKIEHFDSIENTDLVRMMKVNDEQMIQMMGGVLRHAAASVFVTSFTTSAAFFTNLISRIAYVQLFGLFLGFCILFNLLMNITMIVSFVIVYEKFFEPLSARLGLFNYLPTFIDKTMIKLTSLNHALFTNYLPRIIIKLRFFLIGLFTILGILGLIIVFHYPKLSPPKSRRYQFFQLSHPFERFEYEMRDEFLSYINEDKDNVTNPMLIFIFGVEEIDVVHPFYPDRNTTEEKIIYNRQIDFYDPKVLRWFDTFLRDMNRSDLFTNVQKTYSQWLTIGELLRGFLYSTPKDYSSRQTETEFFVPPTRNDTRLAMNRLFRFFAGSNQIASAADRSASSIDFRLGFLPDAKTQELRLLFFIVNMNVTFNTYTVQDEYFQKLQNYFQTKLEQLKLAEGPDGHVYNQVKHGWFASPQFLFYDLMREVIRGTYTSLIFSMGFALIVLLLTSGNLLITIYAMLTIIFIIADTVAIFVLFGWELSILQTIIIIMSVGLSVDFTVHYGVAYIKADWKRNQTRSRRTSNAVKLNHLNNGNSPMSNLHEQCVEDKSTKPISNFQRLKRWHRRGNIQRFRRMKTSLIRVGSAVFIAGFTSFLAGLSMAPSKLTAFSQMGIFLMLIMFVSWTYATWFFLPLLSFIGPIDKFGDISCGKFCRCDKIPPETKDNDDDIEEEMKMKFNDETLVKKETV